MRHVVLEIPDNEYNFFLRIVKGFSFVKIDKKKSKLLELEGKLDFNQQIIWDSLKNGINEVEMMQKGNLIEKTSDEFLSTI